MEIGILLISNRHLHPRNSLEVKNSRKRGQFWQQIRSIFLSSVNLEIDFLLKKLFRIIAKWAIRSHQLNLIKNSHVKLEIGIISRMDLTYIFSQKKRKRNYPNSHLQTIYVYTGLPILSCFQINRFQNTQPLVLC